MSLNKGLGTDFGIWTGLQRIYATKCLHITPFQRFKAQISYTEVNPNSSQRKGIPQFIAIH